MGRGEPRVGGPTLWEVGCQRWLPEKVTSRVGYKGWMGVSQIEMVRGYPQRGHLKKLPKIKIKIR